MALRSTSIVEGLRAEPAGEVSLFERFPWLYAFFRERLFRDDTDRIVHAFWPSGMPQPGAILIELGCGPGFYARRLSERFPSVSVVGIDRSKRQLALAVERTSPSLNNCRFETGDAQAIGFSSSSVDGVIASRLMTILPDPERAVSEIHRVLQPDGRCFIAEPRPHPIAHIPLDMLWAAAGIARLVNRRPTCYREPVAPTLLETTEFAALISSQPWRQAHIFTDGRYQYAVCTKG